jgi:hypothetical protein
MRMGYFVEFSIALILWIGQQLCIPRELVLIKVELEKIQKCGSTKVIEDMPTP